MDAEIWQNLNDWNLDDWYICVYCVTLIFANLCLKIFIIKKRKESRPRRNGEARETKKGMVEEVKEADESRKTKGKRHSQQCQILLRDIFLTCPI